MMPPKVAVTRPVVTAACHCPVSAKPISVPTTVDDAIPIASDHRNARCVSLNAEWLMMSVLVQKLGVGAPGLHSSVTVSNSSK